MNLYVRMQYARDRTLHAVAFIKNSFYLLTIRALHKFQLNYYIPASFLKTYSHLGWKNLLLFLNLFVVFFLIIHKISLM